MKYKLNMFVLRLGDELEPGEIIVRSLESTKQIVRELLALEKSNKKNQSDIRRDAKIHMSANQTTKKRIRNGK
jgi:hypothetical protein